MSTIFMLFPEINLFLYHHSESKVQHNNIVYTFKKEER